MATTYTPSGRLWQGTPGDPAVRNVWGTALDTNFSLIESLILGSATISVTGLTTYTLTTANGAADQSRPLLQIYTGALIANCAVTMPTVPKFGWAQNNTTGGFSIVLNAGAGTTVTIPPDGQMRWFQADGAGNVVFPSIGFAGISATTLTTSGNVTLGGTVTAAGNVTVTSGGVTITGNSTLTGTLTGLTGLTVASGGASVTGGATITGGLTVDTLTLTTGLPPGVFYGDIKDSGITLETGGWRLCYGQTRPRTDPLWVYITANSIAWPYGNGDGSTTYTMPDLRGRSRFGKDNMGGSVANRITSGVSGIGGTTLGATGGDQSSQAHTHTASASDGGHGHGAGDYGHSHGITDNGHTHPQEFAYYQDSGSGSTPGFISQRFHIYQPTALAYTGIGINNGNANIYINTGYANVSVTVNSTLNGGSQNMPPAAIVNTLMYVGA